MNPPFDYAQAENGSGGDGVRVLDMYAVLC